MSQLKLPLNPAPKKASWIHREGYILTRWHDEKHSEFYARANRKAEVFNGTMALVTPDRITIEC